MSDAAILVVSCDAYADLWGPFFTIFFSEWTDCPFRVYLGTNHLRYDDPRVTTIDIGDDVSWASNAALMLNGVDADHVILFLEDFFIEEPVITSRLQRLVEIARSERLGCLRLVGHPPLAARPAGDAPGYPDLGIIEPGAAYRVSAQAAIWRKDTLLRLLIPGADPWEFELLASTLSCNLAEPFWGVKETALQYDHAVEKRRWTPKGRRMADETGFRRDSRRPIFTAEELEAHRAASSARDPQEQKKSALKRHFRNGDRVAGLRAALDALKSEPTSIRLWAVTAAGAIGPRALMALEALIFRLRITRLQRRQARREH